MPGRLPGYRGMEQSGDAVLLLGGQRRERVDDGPDVLGEHRGWLRGRRVCDARRRPWCSPDRLPRQGGSDADELVASISGAVGVGRACSALLRVLVVLSRCFEWPGLFVRFISFLQWATRVVGVFRCVLVRAPPVGADTRTD